jgi:D-xylose transport system substrate-binding protein
MTVNYHGSQSRRRKARLLATAGLALTMAVGTPAVAQDALDGTVFFLAPGQQDAARWLQQDAPALTATIKELAPGLDVEVLDGNMDVQTQETQAQTAITKGAKAVLLVSVDENTTGGMLQSLAEAGIPVVLYDHAAKGGPAAARVFYNFFDTGVLQGQALVEDIKDPDGPYADHEGPIRLMRIFIARGVSITEAFAAGQDSAWEPMIASGKIELVCDDWAVLGGDPFDIQIQRLSEQCLTRQNNDIDAALSLNDQFATYVLAALNTAGLLGQVPVYGGQDADISGIHNLIRGYQTATVYKPQIRQARVAAEVVVSLVQSGELPPGDYETENNGTADIPIVALEPSLIRKDDIGILIEDEIYTWDQICTGDVASDPICVEGLATQ